MKTIYTLIFILLFANISLSQKNNLFKTVEPDSIDTYLALNDISFIWALSKNSCKFTEDSLLFENPEVVNFYSKYFTCYTINIDSTYFKNQVEIKIDKSGYYFVDSTATVIHKNLKQMNSAKDLVQMGTIALDTSLRYDATMHRYYCGDRNFSFLLHYLKTRKNAKELITKDIDDFIFQIDTINRNQAEIREFIFNYFFCRTYDNGYYYFNPNSKPFKILITDRELFIKEFDEIQVDLRINALLNFGLKELIQNKDLPLIEKSAAFFNNTIPTYKLINSDEESLLYLKGNVNDTIDKLQALRAFYYLEKGDTSNFIFYEEKYLELAKSNPVGLFFIANYYYRYFEDSYFIKKSENILRKAYELDANNYEIVGLLAELLYNSNKYDEAIYYIRKAIRLYIENKISPSQFLLFEENIHKGQNDK